MNCYTLLLHLRNLIVSSSVSDMFAQCGRIMRPLIEKMHSAGANITGAYKVRRCDYYSSCHE